MEEEANWLPDVDQRACYWFSRRRAVASLISWMLYYDGEELVNAEETESGFTLRNESLLYD